MFGFFDPTKHHPPPTSTTAPDSPTPAAEPVSRRPDSSPHLLAPPPHRYPARLRHRSGPGLPSPLSDAPPSLAHHASSPPPRPLSHTPHPPPPPSSSSARPSFPPPPFSSYPLPHCQPLRPHTPGSGFDSASLPQGTGGPAPTSDHMDRSGPKSKSRSSPRTLLDLATVAVQSRTDHGYPHPDTEASRRITIPPISDVAYRARPPTHFWRSQPPPPGTSAGTSTGKSTARVISGIPRQPLAPDFSLHRSYHAPRSDLAIRGTALHRPSASRSFNTSQTSLPTLMSTLQTTGRVSADSSGSAGTVAVALGRGGIGSETHGDDGTGRPHPLANLNLDQTYTERKVAQWEAQAQRILQPLEMPRTPPATARSQPTPPPRPHSHSSSHSNSRTHSYSHLQSRAQTQSQSQSLSQYQPHAHPQSKSMPPHVRTPSSSVFGHPSTRQNPGESWTSPSQPPPPHGAPHPSDREHEREGAFEHPASTEKHHRVHPPPHGLVPGLLPSHAHQAGREAYVAQYNARIQAIVGATATVSEFESAAAPLIRHEGQAVAAMAGKIAPLTTTQAVPSPIEPDESATPGRPDWRGSRGNRVGQMTVAKKGLIFIDDPLSALVRMGERSALSEHEPRSRLPKELDQGVTGIGAAGLPAHNSSAQGGEGRERTERITLDMVASASEALGYAGNDERREGPAAIAPEASSVSTGSDEPVFDAATRRVSGDESSSAGSSAGSESEATNTPTATSRSFSGEDDGDDPTDPTYYLPSRPRKPSSSVPLPSHSGRGRNKYPLILPAGTSTSSTSNNSAEFTSLRIKREPTSPLLSALPIPHSATPTGGASSAGSAGGTGTDTDRPAKRRKVRSEPLGSVAPKGMGAGHDDSGIGLGVLTASRSRSGGNGLGRRDKEKRKLQNKVSQKSYRDRKKRKAEQMQTQVEDAMELNIVLQRKLKDAEDRNLRLARENGTLKRKVIEMERTPLASASASMCSTVESSRHGSHGSGSGSGGDGGHRNREAELDKEQQEQERAQATSKKVQAGEAMPVDHIEVEEVGLERDAKPMSGDSQAGSKEEKSHPGQAGVEEVEQAQDTAGAFEAADHAQAILHAQADLTRPASATV